MPVNDFTLPSTAYGSFLSETRGIVDFATMQFRFEESSDPNIQLDPIPPNYIISFTYEDTVATSADTVNIELFDTTWTTIEDLIIAKHNKLQFRFGWSLGKKSVWKKITVVSHTPTFEINGIRLSIEGYDETVSSNDEAKTRDWSDKQYIHEIVQAIADENGWNYDNQSIETTKKVLDEEGKSKIFVQKQKADLSFIKDDLLKYSQNEDDLGGFLCWYDVDTNTLYFRTPELSAPVVKTYLVHRDRMGEVISFAPDLGDGSLQRQIGAINTRMVGLDPFKKELIDVNIDNKKSTDGKILLGEYIPDQEIKSTGGAGRFFRKATLTSDAATIVAKQRWFERFNMFFTAEMEVVGDPSIKPGTNIGVICLDSNNSPFYCSGKFYVESVTHSIDNGNFISHIKMWKNAMRDGAINAKTIEAGQIRDKMESMQSFFQEQIVQQTDSSFLYVPPVPISFPGGYPTY